MMRLTGTGMIGRKLFVSFKISERCNLACTYCYFFFKGDESYQDNPAFISEEMVRSVAEFLAKGARENDIETVEIALHGGEPLMVGRSRFAAYCNILKEIITPHAELALAVQTNGLLLDQRWLDLLTQLNVAVGISIDGPKSLNDAVRIDEKGRGSYDRTVKAIDLLKENVAKGQIENFGCLSVLDPNSDPQQVYHHIVHELGIKKVDFMLPKDNWDNADFNEVKKIEAYSLALIKCWLEDDDPTINIRSFKHIMAPFLTDLGVECRTNYILDLTEAITIRSNGDVSPDDTTPALSSEYLYTGYNVQTHSLSEFYADPLWTDIRNMVATPPQQCSQCHWVGFCGGGQIEMRYSKANKFNNPTIYCQRNKMLYQHMYQYLSTFVDQQKLDRNIERSNQSILSRGKMTASIPIEMIGQ